MSDTKDAFGRTVSRRRFLSTAALAGVGVAGSGALLSACGGGGTSPSGTGSGGKKAGNVTWASWANPGEAERFKQFNADYEKRTGAKVTYQNVTGTYATKMLTQLSGGSAPDAFYVGDDLIGKAVESKALLELSQFPGPKGVYDKTYPGLSKWATSAEGGVYGVDVDCNPNVFWFNKKLLAAAGVSQDPAAAFEAGTWNQAALTDLLTKVKATGKKTLAFDVGYGEIFSWITTFGGTVFDDSGKAVFDTDPKAQAAIEWILDQMKSGNIIYTGSLPKGQGAEQLFYAGQLAVTQKGRWILPNLKKLKSTVDYDIAPFPSEDGKTVAPVVVFTACMSINAKAKDQEAALAFLTDFCGVDGQKFRLSGGGNAVSTIKGNEALTTEGNDPPHAAIFNEVAAKGYAIPLPLVRSAKKAADFPLKNDVLLRDVQNQTAKSYAGALVQLLNA
jgi:multiple sugar transport system substrate-binding protein